MNPIVSKVLNYTLVAVLALATLGAFFPQLPMTGAIGAIILNWFGPWVALLSLFATVKAFIQWRRSRARFALTLAMVAALALVGSAKIVGTQWRTVAANGIQIDMLRALYPGPVSHRSGKPEVASYTQFQGEDIPIEIIRPAAGSSVPAPVFVYVHGGGFVGGVYWQRNHDLRWFADQGFVVVSVEYTLSNKSRHLWNLTEDQIGCALVWVNANIAQYGGDPSRVALFGDSAGGNLVINVANRARNGTLRPVCAGAVPNISAVIANYPVVDLRMKSNTGGKLVSAYIGGSPDEFPDRYAAAATATHLSDRSPPLLLLFGQADQLLPPGPTYFFAQQVKAAGIPVELIDLPYAGHEFEFMAGSIPNQLFRQATMRFLTRNGISARN